MPRGYNIANSVKERIYQLHLSGYSSETLAERFGLTDRVIRKIIEEHQKCAK